MFDLKQNDFVKKIFIWYWFQGKVPGFTGSETPPTYYGAPLYWQLVGLDPKCGGSSLGKNQSLENLYSKYEKKSYIFKAQSSTKFFMYWALVMSINDLIGTSISTFIPTARTILPNSKKWPIGLKWKNIPSKLSQFWCTAPNVAQLMEAQFWLRKMANC